GIPEALGPCPAHSTLRPCAAEVARTETAVADTTGVIVDNTFDDTAMATHIEPVGPDGRTLDMLTVPVDARQPHPHSPARLRTRTDTTRRAG
ncbi:MAG: hypothetical protein ACRDQA_01065, partial [Nocardioidaceae bacterium]